MPGSGDLWSPRLMLPPLSRPLIHEPFEHGLPLVAAIPPELEVRHPAGARLGAHPRFGHIQPLSYLLGIEEAIAGHAAVFSRHSAQRNEQGPPEVGRSSQIRQSASADALVSSALGALGVLGAASLEDSLLTALTPLTPSTRRKASSNCSRL